VTGFSNLCLVAVGTLLLAHVAAEARAWPILRAATKVGASLGFVVLAISLGVDSPFDRLVLGGLCLALVGDTLLLSDRRPPFLGGLGAFLLAHVAYGVAFGMRASPPAWAALPIAAALGLVLRWLWPHLGDMRLPVVVYSLVISTMLLLALGVPGVEVRLGAVLFYLSDLFVARDRFVRKQLGNRLVGLPLYYAGQVLIALAVR